LIHDIKRKLQECKEIARSNLKQTKQRRIENQKDKVIMPLFQTGNNLLENEKPGKLDPLWLGPYKIV
jgi:hypothetical protein